MGIIAQNKISSLGMLFGAIALMMGIIHFSFGPFSAPPPTLESIVADKTAEIKRGLLAGIKGEKITTVEKKEDMDIDSFKKAVDGVDDWFVQELKKQGYNDGQDLVDLFTK